MKMEIENLSSPDVPPGFEPLPPPPPPQNTTVAAVEPAGDQNRTPHDLNVVLSDEEEGEIRESLTEQVRRRTGRKRSRPVFYQPRPPKRLRTAASREAPARCRGRPPKDLFPLQEAQNRDSNEASLTPLTRPQGQAQGAEPYFYHPVHLSAENSTAQAKNQVEPEPNKNGTTRERSSNRSNFYQAHTIEEAFGPFPEVPRNERSRNVGCYNKMSEGIDAKILQRVVSALEFMDGSETSIEYKNVYSRSPENLVRTIKAIEKKYGAITKNSSLESDCMKTLVMIGICKVVQDLQRKQLNELDISSLDSYYTVVRDAESVKVDVQWLHKRLDDIKEVVTLSREVKDLEIERTGRISVIDRKMEELLMRKVELDRIKSEVQEIEQQLTLETAKVEELNKKQGESMSRILAYQNGSLMDGLV